MKLIYSLSALVLPLIFVGFFKCSSSKGLQETPPVKISGAYFQHWTSGVKGGGAGIDIYLPIKEKTNEDIMLDSVYFRNMGAKLERNPETENMYVGHLISGQNSQKDLILSSDPKEEFKNKLPESFVQMPLQVNKYDCIISYKENGQLKYFIVENLEEREPPKYPQAPNNN